ncbi:MAG: hypothetical protein AB7V25_14380 [Mangrovibacterium sp.]
METNTSAGFSSRIDDPKFAKYIRDSNRWAKIFAIGLAVLAVIGFYINGEVSDNMENPDSLYAGFVIAAMFLSIGFYQVWARNRSKTWDGTVIDKKVYKRVKRMKNQSYRRVYLTYKVIIRSDAGKKKVISVQNSDELYNYFKVGDRVRHHKGLRTFEKYDKTGDTIIYCNACRSRNKIEDEYCFRCKCPLLK